MVRKEISPETVVKAIVTGFVSYGIIFIIICAALSAYLDTIFKKITVQDSSNLYIVIPICASFMLYFLIHFLCRLSTYDVFKNCKTNKENYSSIIKYLTIFFITIIFLIIIVFLSLFYLNLKLQSQYINLAEHQYESLYSNEHTGMIMEKMQNDFNKTKTNLTNSTIILTLGFSLSILSLIPYQYKMIKRYNEDTRFDTTIVASAANGK